MKICMVVGNDMVYDSRVDRHAETLGMNGHDVTVLCVLTSRTRSEEKRPHYTIIRKRDLLRRLIEAKTRVKTVGAAVPNTTEISELPSVLKFLKRTCIRLAMAMAFDAAMIPAARKVKADLYICNDFDTLRVGAFMRLLGRKLVYDAHELYSDLFAETPPFVRRLLRQIEAALIKFADLVITVNEFIANELSSRYSIPIPTVIMNCPRKPAATPATRERKGKPRVALYHGGLARGRGLENLVLACRHLRDDIIVVLRGEGSIESKLRDLASGIENCRFEKPVPVSEVVAKASEADVGIVIYLPTTLNNLYASPNKLFEYLRAGLPVVGSDLPFIRKVIVDNGVGLVFDANDPRDIAEAINSITLDEAFEKAKLNVEKVKQLYSWENESQKLLAAISTLVSTGK